MGKIKIIIILTLLLGYQSLLSVETTGREIRSINNNWEFIKTDFESEFIVESKDWQQVNIPHTWNTHDAQSGDGFYRGTAWYRKTITFEKALEQKRIFIRFEGVGHITDIYVNGKFIGNHKGAYSAFCFEITRAIKFNEKNEIYIRVNNVAQPEIIPQNHFLFTIFGGIYRPVSIIITDKLNITPIDYASPGIYIRQKKVTKKKAVIIVKTKLENKFNNKKCIKVRTTILDDAGKKAAENTLHVDVRPTGVKIIEQELDLKKPHLWHGRKNPYLYKVITEVILENKIIDRVIQPLGVRYFHFDADKGFFLNGEPYRLYGICRHQEWRDHGSGLSKKQHKIDMELIKEIGATSVRLAHYQQAEYVYSLLDTMGIVVWAEIPFVNKWSGEESENVKQQMIELIRQNYNHPSIFIWGLYNEVHNKPNNHYPTELIKTLNNIAKSEDPDRLTVGASNIWWLLDDPIHFQADLQGFNQYTGWYGGKPPEIENWIKNTKKKVPDVPFCISEYGAGANLDHQSDDLVPPDPSGKFFPEGYQAYYHEVKWAIFEKYPLLWSTYVWNMFDFTCPLWARGGTKGDNHKGLITYDRKIKKDAFYWYKANWSDEPVLHLTGRRFIKRKSMSAKFTAYCNIADPVLELNGVRINGMKNGGTSVHFFWEDVAVKKGMNSVKVTTQKNGKIYEDSYEFEVM